MRKYKIVVLGSPGVGKSALTVQFVQGIFVERYDPTIEDSYKKWFEVDEHLYMLEIIDSAGTEQFSAMRDVYMNNGDGFVLVYSITSQSTLDEALELHKQILRIKKNNNTEEESVPMILVGNKCDLINQRVVHRYEGNRFSANNNCQFLEASAKASINVKEIFVDIVRQLNKIKPKQKPRRKRKRKCNIL